LSVERLRGELKADNGKRKEERETLSVERLRGEGDLKAELSREGN
jgi:hypothetical protein